MGCPGPAARGAGPAASSDPRARPPAFSTHPLGASPASHAPYPGRCPRRSRSRSSGPDGTGSQPVAPWWQLGSSAARFCCSARPALCCLTAPRLLMPSRLRPCRSITVGLAAPPPQLPGRMDADSPQTRLLSRSSLEPPYCLTSLPWQRGRGLAAARGRASAPASRVPVSPRAVFRRHHRPRLLATRRLTGPTERARPGRPSHLRRAVRALPGGDCGSQPPGCACPGRSASPFGQCGTRERKRKHRR